ncbi:MAG: hypothetical protein LUC32_07200 [Clostridiales bacterium]|nr:hypothetical protein [Clostridiales bacterium]
MAAAVAYQPTAYGFCLEKAPFCGKNGRKRENKQHFRQLGTHLNCIKDEILIEDASVSGQKKSSKAQVIKVKNCTFIND